jgi:hypothetical protein
MEQYGSYNPVHPLSMAQSHETFSQPLIPPCQNPLDIPHEMHMLQQRLLDYESCLAHATHTSTKYVAERIHLVQTNDALEAQVRDMRTKYKEASERRRLRDARQYYTISNMRKEIAALQMERESVTNERALVAEADNMVSKKMYEDLLRDKEALFVACIELREDKAKLLHAQHIVHQQDAEEKTKQIRQASSLPPRQQQHEVVVTEASVHSTIPQPHHTVDTINTPGDSSCSSVFRAHDDVVSELHAKIRELNKATNTAACKASVIRKRLEAQVAELEHTLATVRKDLEIATALKVPPTVSPSKPKKQLPFKLVGPRGGIVRQPPPSGRNVFDTASSSDAKPAVVHTPTHLYPFIGSAASIAADTETLKLAFASESSTTLSTPSSSNVETTSLDDARISRDTARWRCAANIVRKLMDDFTNLRALYQEKFDSLSVQAQSLKNEQHLHKRQRTSLDGEVTVSSMPLELPCAASSGGDKDLLECIHQLHTRMNIQHEAYAKEKALFNNGLRFYLLLMTQYVPICTKEHQSMLQSCIEQLEQAVLQGESLSMNPPTNHSLTIAEPD